MPVRALAVVAVCAFTAAVASAHGSGAAITWNREISRLVFDKCASCHRPEGTAFPLLTYKDVQPRTNEIKEAVLARRMPPWGAVKGFGSFRNDDSLSQEQIELVTKWVDGGIRRGNNPAMLPNMPQPKAPPPLIDLRTAVRIKGPFMLDRALVLDGLLPETVPAGQSMQIVAVLPTGRIEPLLWLHGYESKYLHPFLLRRPIALPAGTAIRGVLPGSSIALLPAPRAL
jgi:mono/diheme cytochrome c family protein